MIAALPRSSAEMPLPVARWLEVAWANGVDEVASLRVEGSVRVHRRRGWLRGSCTMSLQAGVAYATEVRVGLRPLPSVRGLDAYVDGHGVMTLGRDASTGPAVDEAAFLALWAESILFPSCWERLPGLRFTPVDDTEALVALPFGDGIITATLRFDPEISPFPLAFEAVRRRMPGGPRFSWQTLYDDWHWRNGLALPTHMRATWADEPNPWFELHVERVVPNAPVGDELDRARHVLASHLAAAR